MTFERDVAAALQMEAAHRKRLFAKGLGWGGLTVAILWFTGDQIGMNPLALIKGANHMWDFITLRRANDVSFARCADRSAWCSSSLTW